jgi:hypothetical protein
MVYWPWRAGAEKEGEEEESGHNKNIILINI